MNKDEMIQKLKSVVEKPVAELGYTIVKIVFEKEEAYDGREAIVVYINKTGGITIEDCVKVHKRINVILEEEDPIKGSYILEVSSLGTETEHN